jgi:hypothetical protein
MTPQVARVPVVPAIMRHRQDDTSPARELHVCDTCTREFIVPVSVVDLIDEERCIVELSCMNCGTASLGVHDDQSLMELDRHLDLAQDQMREAVEVLEIADDLDRIDRFVRALRDDHILPEDF